MYSLRVFGLMFLSIASLHPFSSLAHPGDGVYTRTIELKVRPGDVAAWERALATIASTLKAASKLPKETDWLVYRKRPAQYFVVINRSDLAQTISLANLNEAVATLSARDEFKNALERLLSLEYSITDDSIWHQDGRLSTAIEMSTASNPLAIVTEYSISPSQQMAFNNAMEDYMGFLKTRGYPYPIEGFHGLVGKPQRFMSVNFPDTWSRYHSGGSIESFALAKNVSGERLAHIERLMRAVRAIKETRLEYAPDLSM